MDFSNSIISIVYFGMAGLEIFIFLAGTLFLRKEINQLAGWRLFCFFAFFEIGSVVASGTGALIHSNVTGRQTAFQLLGALNLASHLCLGKVCKTRSFKAVGG